MIETGIVRVDAQLLTTAERCALASGISLSEWVSEAIRAASGKERGGLGDQLLGMANPTGREFSDADIDQLRRAYLEEKHVR